MMLGALLPPFATPWQVASPPTTPMQGSPTPATPWLGFAQKRGSQHGRYERFSPWHIFSFPLRCNEKEMPRYSGFAAKKKAHTMFATNSQNLTLT
jgi:hypothetical protein